MAMSDDHDDQEMVECVHCHQLVDRADARYIGSGVGPERPPDAVGLWCDSCWWADAVVAVFTPLMAADESAQR